MNLKDLLSSKSIDPKHVLVLRHRPFEPELNKVLPWLAAERPDLFNAYQQTQTKQVEQEMTHAAHIAAFIGHEPNKALFVGLYSIKGWKPLTYQEYWQVPANIELKSFGLLGNTESQSSSNTLWFELVLTDFYNEWKGKLVIRWPPLDRNWHRWADRPKNEMPVFAILEESRLEDAIPEWDEMDFTWDELRVLPKRWKSKLSEWRGIYYIFDTSDGKGYIGSAYGENNLLGRWENYADRGHGDNRLLLQRSPRNFRFTILQRVSPDMKEPEVIQLESSWKQRLHTRECGLNDN